MLRSWFVTISSQSTGDTLDLDLKGYTQLQVMREAERRFRNHYGYARKKDLLININMKET